jgi:hypothetical protein
MFQIKVVEKKKTHILCLVIFFSENRAIYEMWKVMVQPQMPKMTTQYGTCALHAG